ncbi:uncharacterized protein B0H64DRAFT_386902 [Chaetomium fimeti]|uniref:HMG box domain-containing protein n=1 Tax=Chaetomium fimeti TaxID=1854472 RepID=A0AAE0LVG0_9PEZI|nr:hypothetical protein B0H64DRAFT_386902 [Chaetomium fimeti]
MLSAFGRVAARQAYVASSLSIRSASRLAAPVIPSGFRVVAVFTRGFAAAGAPKKTATKAKTSAAPKKTTAAKKPAKTTTKKTATKKAAKPKAKAAKKPTGGRAKKPLTDEEKAKKKLRALKQKALLKEQPAKLPVAPWAIFVTNNLKEVLNKDPKPEFAEAMRQLAAEYKALPQQEKEKLDQEGQKNRTANEVTLKNWIDSRTAQDIRGANVARSTLKRMHSVSVKPTLPDPRFPKRPMTPYIAFIKARYAAHAFEDLSNPARVSKLSAEWNNLGAQERKEYEGIAATDSARFKTEMDAYRETAQEK